MSAFIVPRRGCSFGLVLITVGSERWWGLVCSRLDLQHLDNWPRTELALA
jgi:hypothetical protein